MLRGVVHLLFCAQFTFSASAVLADDAGKDADVHVRCDVSSVGVTSFSELDLGALPLGTKARIRCTIFNRTNESFKIAKAVVSCSCTSFQSDATIIEPGDSSDIVFVIATSEAAKKPVVGITIQLRGDDDEDQITTLAVKYSPAGLVNFHQEFFIWEIGEKDSDQILLPFFANAPQSPEEVDITLSEELASLVIAEVNTENAGGPWIALTLKDPKKRIKSNLLARVSLQGSSPGVSSSSTILVRPREPIQIAPTTLRFGDDPLDPDSLLATAIVRLDPDAFGIGKDNVKDFPAVDRCQILFFDRELETKIDSLAPGLFRLRIHLKKQLYEDQRHENTDAETVGQSKLKLMYQIHAGKVISNDEIPMIVFEASP